MQTRQLIPLWSILMVQSLTFTSIAVEPLPEKTAPFAVAQTQPSTPEPIDYEKAQRLIIRFRAGEKLTAEERAYVERARAARASSARSGQNPRMTATTGKATTGMKPITEMTAEDNYKGQDGGIYGKGQNEPPQVLSIAAAAATRHIVPRDAQGKPAPTGVIGFISISMSNATQEFSRFKQLADADADKSALVTIVDCAQGGQAMREWADPQAPPWAQAMQRLEAARISPPQVQVAWIKIANKGPRGELSEHGKQLETDTLAVLANARNKFPNLRMVYLSSRIYGGWATGALNPEPYAYEGGFVVRALVLGQLKQGAKLDADAAPILVWGPYLWADGENARKADGLVYTREDLANDGVHPSELGRTKVAQQLLRFFKNDPYAKGWFVKAVRP